MKRKGYKLPWGTISYWVNEGVESEFTLIFLPGLTADHRLFDKQVEYFKDKCRVLVWDAPGHGLSRPFELDFPLNYKARWVREIVAIEKISRPVLVGQSMGGYVAQCYMQLFPKDIAGFISIDSAPLKRKYVTGAEIWMLRNCEWIYRLFPWKLLVNAGADGCARTEYGRTLMRDMMLSYDKDYYCRLAGHGYRMLADAMAADLPYEISCPALLVCGEKDRAASTKRYNKTWSVAENLPIYWVPDAGHNSNADCPESVNSKIEEFLSVL